MINIIVFSKGKIIIQFKLYNLNRLIGVKPLILKAVLSFNNSCLAVINFSFSKIFFNSCKGRGLMKEKVIGEGQSAEYL